METKHLPRDEWLRLIATSPAKNPRTRELLENGEVALVRDGVRYTTDPIRKTEGPTHSTHARVKFIREGSKETWHNN